VTQFEVIRRKEDGLPIRCLIVDDSLFARKHLRTMVETLGCEVAGEASDGLMAITEYGRINPDLVLMDIIMPKMGGIEATRRILRQYPKARILMISSVGYQENISAALQSGAQHFLQKPIKPEALYEAIQLMFGEGRTPLSVTAANGPTAAKTE
jgi:two-component system chemotaxis response regulator CheY